MESTGSSTTKTSQPLAISDEGNKLGQQTPASSASNNNNNRMNEMIPEFMCGFCPRTFDSERGRAGHQKVHTRGLHQVRQIQKERRRLPPAGSQVCVLSSLSHFHGLRSTAYFDLHAQVFNWHYFRNSGFVPFFAGRGAHGRAPAQRSSWTNPFLATGRGGQVGRGGHLGSLRKVNQGETAHGIPSFPSLRSSTMPMFLSQTGNGTRDLAHPSFAHGVHFGSQQDMPEVNHEEATDGIDLTLRL